jgi:hypothetical protein
MKARTMRNILRRTRTVPELHMLLGEYTWTWAGSHKGRRRVVRMLDRERRRREREEVTP